MEIYKELYLMMVRAAEKAINEIEQMNFGAAKQTLIAAELEAEERYLRQEDE